MFEIFVEPLRQASICETFWIILCEKLIVALSETVSRPFQKFSKRFLKFLFLFRISKKRPRSSCRRVHLWSKMFRNRAQI